MVPENIHTPTTEGIGNSGEEGVVSEFTFPDGQVQCQVRCHANLFQNRFLPTLKIFYIEQIAA